ncbi:hypothetical protein BDA99DRAFT_518055 [Phascolomyces articulosus]|uniref:Bromo domain-containing protein n=1 Tax=Phascolomyces articulosus TaxID=60185 RepID=A0AAD5K4T2_9FUNG|nr:hypothetical protein BDA99DRAFT_518055 [Phascolomyces articulosus]
MASYASDEEQPPLQQTSAPRIKLKLRLNPSSNGGGRADASIVSSTTHDIEPTPLESTEDRKRKKHKKKKSHKKHKRQKKNQESDDEEIISRKHQHHGRRESEQLDIDGDDEKHYRDNRSKHDNNESVNASVSPQPQRPAHVPVGGKRPFALIQAEQQRQQQQQQQQQQQREEEEEEEEEEENDDDEEINTTMIQYKEVLKPIKQEEESILSTSSFEGYAYQQQREDHHRNTIHDRTVHPTEAAHDTFATRPTSSHHPSSSKATNAIRTKTPPSRQRTASVSTTASASENKPKKRGRPVKVKAPPPKPEPRPPPESAKKDKDLKTIATKLIDTLERRDSYGLFLQPVDTSIVTDYLTVIKHPMDFQTMREKLNTDEYSDMEDFRQDFLLICTNAKTYNAPDTIYYRNADRLEQYGLKAIDRAAKTVVYDSPQPMDERGGTPYSDDYYHHHSSSLERRWGSGASSSLMQQPPSVNRRTSSISTITGGANNKRDSNVKMEEEVDILGLDNGSSIYPGQRKQSRHDSDVTMTMRDTNDASSSRAPTPVRAFGMPPTKKKKKKVTEAGIVYASDGSLAGVGGVSDLQTLIPPEQRFSEVPGITMVNTHALPSAFYTTRGSYEEWASHKHPTHPAHFADYGAFTALGNEPPGAFYTAQDACYIYPLYGDDRGEAYMRSLWEFADGVDDLKDTVYNKSNYLTRGAWDVLQEALKDVQDVKEVDAEFGQLHVSEFEKAYESATKQ